MKKEARRAGRDGLLRLYFERRGSQTVLASAHFTSPLQVMQPTPVPEEGSLLLFLLNPTGGVVAGDRLVTEISLAAGAHVCLTTPSATRVYRSQGEPALIETRIRLSAGAVLEYVPDRVIPFAGAVLHNVTHVAMEGESRLILYDGLCSGRVARGERWAFAEYKSEVAVERDGRRLFLDRAWLRPPEEEVAGPLRMGPYHYLDTFFAFREGQGGLRQINRIFETGRGIQGAAFPLPRGGVLARALSQSAIESERLVRSLWVVLRRALLGRPPLDLRKL